MEEFLFLFLQLFSLFRFIFQKPLNIKLQKSRPRVTAQGAILAGSGEKEKGKF